MRLGDQRASIDQLIEQHRIQRLRRHAAEVLRQRLRRVLHIAQMDRLAVDLGDNRVGGRLGRSLRPRGGAAEQGGGKQATGSAGGTRHWNTYARQARIMAEAMPNHKNAGLGCRRTVRGRTGLPQVPCPGALTKITACRCGFSS